MRNVFPERALLLFKRLFTPRSGSLPIMFFGGRRLGTRRRRSVGDLPVEPGVPGENPVERAMSAFCHVGKYAADRRNICDVLLPPTTSLEEALQWEHCEVRKARDENRVNVRPFEQFHDDPCWAFQHLRNSTYLNDLRHFQSVFDQRQMLIVLSEELRREPATTFQRIARFLEIDPDFLPSNLQQEYNTTELVKRGTVVRVVRAVARRVPVRFACRNAVLRATLQKKPCLSGTQRQELAALFAPHNRSLGDEFDLDLETFWT